MRSQTGADESSVGGSFSFFFGLDFLCDFECPQSFEAGDFLFFLGLENGHVAFLFGLRHSLDFFHFLVGLGLGDTGLTFCFGGDGGLLCRFCCRRVGHALHFTVLHDVELLLRLLVQTDVLDFELHHLDSVKAERGRFGKDAVAVLVEFQNRYLVFLSFGLLDNLSFGIIFVIASLFGKHFDRGEVFAFRELVFGNPSEFRNLCDFGFFGGEQRCGFSNGRKHGVSDKVMF